MDLKTLTLLILRRKKRRQQLSARPTHRLKQLFLGCTVSAGLLLAAGILSSALLLNGFLANLPSLEQIPSLLNADDGQLLQPTRIYDRSGTHIYLTLENPGIQRRYLPLDPEQPEFFSPRLVQMTIALQDPGFWRNPGFDWQYITSPEAHGIAELLVERLLLYDDPPGFKRTLQMRLLASQLVSRYSRTQVLEWYLNCAYYGHLAYGADSASWLYFGKPVSQLDITETALLVGLAQTPALNPLDSPAAARQRHHEVLSELLKAGAISQLEYEQAINQPLEFRSPDEQPSNPASAFSRLVLEQLSEEINIRRIEMGGLQIITTLDHDLQTQLACSIEAQLQQIENGESDVPAECDAGRLLPTLPPAAIHVPEGVSASALVLDPNSGEILAMMGKTSLKQESTSISGLQPGSMLTPFIALSAFSRGFSPSSMVWDIPSNLPEGLSKQLVPDSSYHGPLRLRTALGNDYLTPFAHLLEQLTPETVWNLAAPLGLDELNTADSGPDILYQGGEVSSLELAWAYASFATGGVQNGSHKPGSSSLQPVSVLSIKSVDGNIWQDAPQIETRTLLSPQLAYLINHILSDPLARRESLGYPNALETGMPSAAKVGQTGNGNQIWTIGYTPQRLVQTWFGYPTPETCADCTLDIRIAAGLYHAMLQYSARDLPAEDWSAPPGITSRQVCDPSGLLPTLTCPNVVNEVFLDGSEPNAYDNLFQVYRINRETGLLATVFTPLELVEEHTYMNVPDAALSWAQQNHIELPPATYDVIQPSPSSPDCAIHSPSLFDYVHDVVEIRGSAGGEDFVSYRLQIGQGLNPDNWLQIDSEQSDRVQDGLLANWDTSAQEDGLYALRLTVQKHGGEADSAITQVTIDNTPPEIRLLYPSDGDELTLPESGEINLQAEVQDNIGIARVVWLVDGKTLAELQEPPYTSAWQTFSGSHRLQVKAYDLAGNSRESEEIKVQVNTAAQ